MRAFVTGIGIVSPAGSGLEATLEALKNSSRALRPLSLLKASSKGPLPVGEMPDFEAPEGIPRTHALALAAARQALHESPGPVDAVILGGTTGGMPLTEELLKAGAEEPLKYRLHGTGTVADCLAGEADCRGPVLTVSTACSSGAAALKIGLELIRTGKARRVLAGGADAICRLTYHGFGMLQLIDPLGTRPMDKARAGMSVGEGAALLLLEAAEDAPDGAIVELRGGGLSCDAFHASSPHPEGAGALAAMQDALGDAGNQPGDVDYLSLHGTGTLNNDIAESAAIRTLFGEQVPPLSSVKGTFGHSLAAAGAVEAAVSALVIREGLLPANVGCVEVDVALGVVPVLEPTEAEVDVVLSNSLGFGGNNAALVLGRCGLPAPPTGQAMTRKFRVIAGACLSGAGHLGETLASLANGKSAAGTLALEEVTRDLPPRLLRRMKRLPRMTLALAEDLLAGRESGPGTAFLGTGWGPLSETHDFIDRLFKSNEERSSPTDFVGSVHNAVAGQVAIRHRITGANVTATGGNVSFEQALYLAGLLSPLDDSVLVAGVDEAHERLTPLLDISGGPDLADGGGALLLEPVTPGQEADGVLIWCPFIGSGESTESVDALLDVLGDIGQFGAILANVPSACWDEGLLMLDRIVEKTTFRGSVGMVRSALGEYATVPAAAAALAAGYVALGTVPGILTRGKPQDLGVKGILLLTLGDKIAATCLTRA